MAASDVVTASALQLMSMAEKSKEEGILVATVTLPVNVTDGEVRQERGPTLKHWPVFMRGSLSFGRCLSRFSETIIWCCRSLRLRIVLWAQ